MSWRVVEFEETPNPNAMKCWLDRPISDEPQSFRSADTAHKNAIARRLFDEAGATSVLLCGSWITVNKQASQRWPTMQRAITNILATTQVTDPASSHE